MMTEEQANNPNGHEFGKEAEEYISKLPSFLQQVAWNAFLTGASIGAKKYKNAIAWISTSDRLPKERQKVLIRLCNDSITYVNSITVGDINYMKDNPDFKCWLDVDATLEKGE